MLVVKNISKSFKKEVINDFSFTFKEGNFYKLFGKNGCGKTTLMKILKGIYIQDFGTISFESPLNSNKDLVYIDNNSRSFIQRLTVRDNLRYFCSLNSSVSFGYALDLIKYFDRGNLLDKAFSELSSGQMQLISFVRGVSSKPKVLILDEIFSSFDIKVKTKIKEFLSKYTDQQNALVILTSHQDEYENAEIINLDNE